MRTSTQTYARHYVNVKGQNQPINMVPAGIKCIDCNQVFSPDELNGHLATHISPQFIKFGPAHTKSTPDRLSLASLSEDPEKLQQIWVRSFQPAQLPQIELQKKVVARPTNSHLLLKNIINDDVVRAKPEGKRDLVSNLGQTVDQSVEAEQQLSVRKNIKIGRIQNQIQKKQLHVYKNQHNLASNIDRVISKPMPIRDEDTEASDGYNVLPGSGPDRIKQQTPRKENRQTYNISSGEKYPVNPLNIITASRADIPKPLKDTRFTDRLGSPRSTVLDQSNQRPEHRHNHQCPCCKGFYCSYCKSSVPPIYRPVPDEEGNYHFHPGQNERAINFYQEHYYPREDINVCTGCQKKVGPSRMGESTPPPSRNF